MRGRLLPLDELSGRDRGAWADLAGRAVEPNPFAEPDFALAAQQELGGRSTGLLVVEEEDGLTAALPVIDGRWRGVLPSLSTWKHPYVFLGSPLLDDSRPADALSALIETASAKCPHGYVVLEKMSADGPLHEALVTALDRTGLMTVAETSHLRASLHRRADGDYQDHMRPHRRRELRRLRRRLEEELDAPLETVDRAGDSQGVRQFLGLEASGWKGRVGTAMLSKDSDRRFFEEICRRFSAAGRLQLLDMLAGDRSVAMQCNLWAGRGVFCFKIAHDEALARFSPGVQLEVVNAERFHGQSEFDWMDSCAAPDNQMINRLWPDRRRIETIVLARPGLRGRLTRGVLGRVIAVDRLKSASLSRISHPGNSRKWDPSRT